MVRILAVHNVVKSFLKEFSYQLNLQDTVKLVFKELLNKEQIDFKELFTDYQLFYTINLLLSKELLPT